MIYSNELDKLGPALAKAQAEMGGAVKDSDNPFFKSRYADLTSVWKACKEALHSNGFSVIQSPVNKDGRIGVSTMLLHSSGQYITDEYTLGVKKENDPQADGSSITYARRYALAAFAGICPVDDDAESAMHRSKKGDDIPDGIPKPEPEKPLSQPQGKAILEIAARNSKLNSDEANKVINWYCLENGRTYHSGKELITEWDKIYERFLDHLEKVGGIQS